MIGKIPPFWSQISDECDIIITMKAQMLYYERRMHYERNDDHVQRFRNERNY